jgi:hypothetical protein
MMKTFVARRSVRVAVGVLVLSGCATTAQRDVETGPTEIKFYNMSELAGNRYDVVGYLWVDSWRTAFQLPMYPTEDEAMGALRAEAARLGANGLLNVVCMNAGRSRWFQSKEPAFLCYGNAIRIRRNDG